jgi:spore coat polysaccharide biosynthesis protein SpsF
MTVIAVLQARFSSSRLPGKVLKPILGKPMLALQVERIKRSRLIDRLIVATSDRDDDIAIEMLCADLDVQCFRGSLEDVLDRFYRAVDSISPRHVVRLTGDCPLCDPCLIDSLVEFHVGGGYDYSSNTIIPTYPDGLDVEVFRFECLRVAYEEGIKPSHREHVTPFIYQQPQRFKIGSYRGQSDLSHLRWTVDEQIDFDLIADIYGALYLNNPEFSTEDILSLLESHSDWKTCNSSHQRNEGFYKSLLADEELIV